MPVRLLELPVLVYGVPLVVVVILLLALRRSSDDAYLRRRSLLVAGILALFLVLRAWLSAIAPLAERVVQLPGSDELTTALITNPLHQAVNVAGLMVGLLAVLLLASLLVVDLFLVRRLRFEVPKILPDVAAVTLFFFGVLLILYYSTDLDVTGLFTTSAIISVVVGLALQDTLGNLFSGLALQTERTFRVGHWVRFGDQEGVVTDVSWRSTTLRTRDNDLVVIPNAVIGKSVILNYSAPSRAHALSSTVGCHYRHPPAEVFSALEEAVSQTNGILARPQPRFRLTEYGDSSITYQIRYWIRDYASAPEVRAALMTRIWYVFSRRDIEIPFPIRSVSMEQVTPERTADIERSRLERLRDRLRECGLFEQLAEEDLEALARRVREEQFFTGETVVRQGSEGRSLYVIDEGRVEVLVERAGKEERVAELTFPSYFGEMSLMTGEPRSSTVRALDSTRFIVVQRDAMGEVMERNPAIADLIAGTLAERKAELDAVVSTLHVDVRGEEKEEILTRIRHLFGF